jgi:hypothetical protein
MRECIIDPKAREVPATEIQVNYTPAEEAEQRADALAGMQAEEVTGPANEFVLVNVFGLKPRVMGELIVKQAGPVPSDWMTL